LHDRYAKRTFAKTLMSANADLRRTIAVGAKRLLLDLRYWLSAPSGQTSLSRSPRIELFWATSQSTGRSATARSRSSFISARSHQAFSVAQQLMSFREARLAAEPATTWYAQSGSWLKSAVSPLLRWFDSLTTAEPTRSTQSRIMLVSQEHYEIASSMAATQISRSTVALVASGASRPFLGFLSCG
jgi:hypothetical protein